MGIKDFTSWSKVGRRWSRFVLSSFSLPESFMSCHFYCFVILTKETVINYVRTSQGTEVICSVKELERTDFEKVKK